MALFVGETGVILIPNEETKIMQTLTVGHKMALQLVYFDTNGQPMLTPPTPDQSPPVSWSDTNPAAETLSASGGSCSVVAIAPGADTITVAVSVGGTVYKASLDVSVQAVPQVLGSVGIQVASVT